MESSLPKDSVIKFDFSCSHCSKEHVSNEFFTYALCCSQHTQVFSMQYWTVSHRHMAKRMDEIRKAKTKILTTQIQGKPALTLRTIIG